MASMTKRDMGLELLLLAILVGCGRATSTSCPTGGTAGTNGGAPHTGGTGGASSGGTSSGGTSGGGASGGGSAGHGGASAVGGSGGATVCPVKTGGDLCSTVPRFTGVQNVDGVGDDFCDVPATVFAVKGGVLPGNQIVSPVPDVVTARVAWDDAGIRAHFHVDDPVVYADPDLLSFYIGGDTPRYGYWDGVLYDAGLMELGLHPSTSLQPIAAFTGENPPRVTMTYFAYPTVCTPGPCTSPPTYRSYVADLVAPARWAYRTVTGGYEFELFLPWSVLGRSAAPPAGTRIATDLAYSTSDDPNYWSWYPTQLGTTTNPALTGSSFLAINPLPANVTMTRCGSATMADPDCDDRTWCTPALE